MIAGQDFRVILDETKDDMRHIQAEPSGLVCSVLIDFYVKDGKLHDVKYLRGCEGNLRAIGRLVEGQEASKIASTLDGVDCHERGTSCTDQFSRILRSLGY